MALPILAPVLENEGTGKAGYDLKQAVLVLGSHGVSLRGLTTDVMLASYLENSSGRLLALDALSAQHLGIEILTRDRLLGTGRKAVLMKDISVRGSRRLRGDGG